MDSTTRQKVKVSKLVLDGHVRKLLEDGQDPSKRLTGKTTAICMKLISDAMLRPEIPVYIGLNCHDETDSKTSRLKAVIQALDLRHLDVVDNGKETLLVYRIYRELELSDLLIASSMNKCSICRTKVLTTQEIELNGSCCNACEASSKQYGKVS